MMIRKSMRSATRAGTLAMVMATWMASASAQTSERFDLSCVGSNTDGNTDIQKPWSAVYSIDLSSKQYCPDENARRCKAPLAIEEVLPDQLVLMRSWKNIDRTRPNLMEGFEIKIGRADGKLEGRAYFFQMLDETTEATCRVKDFTPFPKPMF